MTEIAKISIHGPFQKSQFDQTHYSVSITNGKHGGGVRILADLSCLIGQV